MSKFECDLTADLLPVYLDGKASPETVAYIQEHIKACPQCREMFDSMAGDVKLPESPVVINKKIRTPKQRMWRFVVIYCLIFAALVVGVSTILIWGI